MRTHLSSVLFSITLISLYCLTALAGCAAGPPAFPGLRTSPGGTCTILADRRLEQPAATLVDACADRYGADMKMTLADAADIERWAFTGTAAADAFVSLPPGTKTAGRIVSIPNARQVAWTHPKGVPVVAAALTDHPDAAGFVRFAGSFEAHRIWPRFNFRISTGETSAEAYEWVVQHRTKHTYPMTAVRILRECGKREGLCIDIGCGSGLLDIELAKRSDLKIIGLDIDPNVKPLFERHVRDAGLRDRLSIVIGDARAMPFADNTADMIVSRGTLTFLPDIGTCLREVRRVLKPTGTAFLGGRYLFTPQQYRMSDEEFRAVVAQSGVADATVDCTMGQWVRIAGPRATAPRKQGTGPHMLVGRTVAACGITTGDLLLVGRSDGRIEKALQDGAREFVPGMTVTALYARKGAAAAAAQRLKAEGRAGRVACRQGTLESLPFDDRSFDLVVGADPMLVFADRPKAIAEIHRVLRPGGVALVGGEFYGMPAGRRVSAEQFRRSAREAGVAAFRVVEEGGQWVEIRKK